MASTQSRQLALTECGAVKRTRPSRLSACTAASENDFKDDLEDGREDLVAENDDSKKSKPEEGRMPHQLDDLIDQGVLSEKDAAALCSAFFVNVESIAFAPIRVIEALDGFGEVKVKKIRAACRQMLGLGFMSGKRMLEYRQNIARYKTGSRQVDALLRGGIEAGSITELIGEFRTGKTQLCHMLAVTCQLAGRDKGGQGAVLWIDTEGTFRPERIISISDHFGFEADVTLNNIALAHAHSTDHLTELLAEAAVLMNARPYALLIVDSIIHLYRSEFVGRGELATRQAHLGRVLRVLSNLAGIFGCAIVLTNQVMAKVDGMPGSDKMPAGGHILAHASTTRLFLKKGRGDARICKILQSPSLPEGEAEFCIHEEGIGDVAVSKRGADFSK